jgi:hypothetical protein
MDTRIFRAARSAYLVFGAIVVALALLWLGAAWKTGVVTWGPLGLLAVLYAACVVWLGRFRIEIGAHELVVARPFASERRLERGDIVAVEFVAPRTRNEGPFTLAIRTRDGAELRLNAKLFTPEAVASLIALGPESPAARRAA